MVTFLHGTGFTLVKIAVYDEEVVQIKQVRSNIFIEMFQEFTCGSQLPRRRRENGSSKRKGLLVLLKRNLRGCCEAVFQCRGGGMEAPGI